MQISTETAENLEFPKVLDDISLKCVSNVGKARIHNLVPANNITSVKDALTEVTEMKNVYVTEGGMAMWHFEDTRILLRKIEPLSSYLEPVDCQEIQNGLEIAKNIEQGISTVIKEAKVRTYDMGGSSSTLEVAEEAVKKMT